MQLVPTVLAACGSFLIAVLWMDLMFDVQVLRHREGAELPEDVLASIAAYYRRVTTTAQPMGRAIATVMVVLLVALAAELAFGTGRRLLALASLPLALGPIGLAGARVVPNAVRLGARADSPAAQSALARSICREHLLCLAGMLGFVALQLVAAGR